MVDAAHNYFRSALHWAEKLQVENKKIRSKAEAEVERATVLVKEVTILIKRNESN